MSKVNGISVDYPIPPSANPTKYCRFCYSQFQIKPLFAVGYADGNQKLLSRIESLVQIRLDPVRDGSSAICHVCQQKLAELELFRDRCQKLHEAVRRCRPFPTLELQLQEIQNYHNYSRGDYSNVCISIEPLVLDNYEINREEDSLEKEEETVLNETCKNLNTTELSIVVDRDDVKKNDRFWKALSRDVDSIPAHVRHALELTGRCREASLAYISPSTIKRIEESMRQSAQLLAHQEELRGTDPKQAMVKYYGDTYWEHPDRFCFSEEEKCTILSIASAIQQKGIRHYLRAAKVEKKEEREKVENSRKLAEILVGQIRKYYQTRESSSEEFKNFFNRLPKIQQCRVYRKPNGTVLAAVRCLICKKNSKATLYADTNRWYIYNYVRHCEKKHYQVKVEPGTAGVGIITSTPKPERRTSRTGRSRSRSRGFNRSTRSQSRSRGFSIIGNEEEEDE